MFRASAFKLNMYETCPRQFKFTYVDHLGDEYKTPKPYLTMGAHVHNSLKDFYEQIEPQQRTYEALEQILRKRWRENRKGFSSLDEERDYGLRALQMLKLYVYKNDMSVTPVMLEDYYDTDIRNDVSVVGRIDRVDKDTEGLHVIDYKTGQFNADEVSDEQLLIYSMIVRANQSVPVYKASYLYLATNQWYSIDVDDELYEPVTEELLEKVDLIKADQSYEPHISKRCKHCDFITICPKRAAAEQHLKELQTQPV